MITSTDNFFCMIDHPQTSLRQTFIELEVFRELHDVHKSVASNTITLTINQLQFKNIHGRFPTILQTVLSN
jgi:hypothetical protein